MTIFCGCLKILYQAKPIEKQLQLSWYREIINLSIRLMSLSLNGKLGQPPKQTNVSGTSWFPDHEFQNFIFSTGKKLDASSDPDDACRKRSSLNPSKIILSAIALIDMQYLWVPTPASNSYAIVAKNTCYLKKLFLKQV